MGYGQQLSGRGIGYRAVTIGGPIATVALVAILLARGGGGVGDGTQFVASQTSCTKIPCGVHFRIVDAADYFDQRYSWNFDDAGGGNHTNGMASRDKNVAFGSEVTHVFNAAGTYDVVLTSPSGTYQVSITVTDSCSASFCYSTSGTFTGCPGGATQRTTSTISTMEADLGSGNCYFFRGGETFTVNNTVDIVGRNGGRFTSYGTGRAIFTHGTVEYVWIFGDGSNGWTINNVQVNQLATCTGDCETLQIGGTVTDLTFTNNLIDDGAAGINCGGFALAAGDTVIDGLVVANNEWHDIAPQYAIFCAGSNVGWLDNIVEDSENVDRGSLIRIQWCRHCDFSNNTYGPASISSGNSHYEPGPPWAGDGAAIPANQYAENVVIKENLFTGDSASIKLGVQNSSEDEKLRNFIIERNLFLTTDAFNNITVDGDTNVVHIRNNLTDLAGVFDHWILSLSAGGLVTACAGVQCEPDNINIYLNTVIGKSDTRLVAFDLTLNDRTINAYANVITVSAAQATAMVWNGGTLDGNADNTLGNAAALDLADPVTTNGPEDFLPAGTSTACGDGNSTPGGAPYAATKDYSLTTRSSAPIDTGAEECP